MDHHKVSIEETARVVRALGLDGYKRLAAQMPEIGVKFGNRLGGQVEALLNMIKPEDVDRLLFGEVSIEIKELVRKFVDRNGRIIPLASMKSAVSDPFTSFKLVRPTDILTSAWRLDRLIRFFPGLIFLSVEKFRKQIEILVEKLRQDAVLSGLMNGVWLPVCYPGHKLGDYGEDLENIFLKAAGDSYEDCFLDQKRKFYNLCKGELKGRVSIVDESHGRLIHVMAEGPFAGLQFFPLQGFSINADRELMASLPKALSLSGPIDLATAMTAYPDVLARDYGIFGYDCSAVSWESARYSLFFGASNDGLKFGSAGNLGGADGRYSGSLVFLG